MIISLLVTLLVILLGLVIAEFVIIRNILNKNSVYEKWILDFRNDAAETIELMRNIDKEGTFATSLNDKGNFESDDQVGQVFKELLQIIESLEEKIQ